MLRITSHAVIALAVTACVAETTDVETETAEQAIATGCPSWGCGENSPVMGPFVGWWELNTDGQLNNKNIAVVDFYVGGQAYDPFVRGGLLYARHPNGTVISGLSLQGGYFRLTTPAGPFALHIAKVNPKATSIVTFWSGPATPIETYELKWSQGAGTGTQNRVCTNPPPGRPSGEGGDHLWNAPLEAMLYTGDRYRDDNKTITHSTYSDTTGWFNIACAGSVLAKLHLNRHTTAGQTLGYLTSALQRQTMFKMYTSDVCGTGTAWTQAGVPLHHQQTTKWSMLEGFEYDIEAQWGPEGALCLDTHRLGDLYTLSTSTYKISDECSVPACNNAPSQFTGWWTPPFLPDAYLVSAVPFDPSP